MVIFHRNGCGPTPEHCGYTPAPDSVFWAGKSSTHMVEANIDIERFWDVMVNKEKYMMKSNKSN